MILILKVSYVRVLELGCLCILCGGVAAIRAGDYLRIELTKIKLEPYLNDDEVEFAVYVGGSMEEES